MEYRERPEISFSDLKVYIKEGFKSFLYYKFCLEREKPSHSWQEFGRKAHMAILEPDKFKKTFIYHEGEMPKSPQMEKFVDGLISVTKLVSETYREDYIKDFVVNCYKESYKTDKMSENDIRTKAFNLYESLKDFIKIKFENYGNDITFISKEEYEILEFIQKEGLKSLTKIISYSGILENFYNKTYRKFELELFGEYEGIPIKGTVDFFAHNLSNNSFYIVDLKTSSNVQKDYFKNAILYYRYIEQLGFYSFLLNQNNYFTDSDNLYYRLLAINSKPPYDMVIYNISNYDVDHFYKNNVIPSLENLKRDFINNYLWDDYLSLKTRDDINNFYKKCKDIFEYSDVDEVYLNFNADKYSNIASVDILDYFSNY
jgi:hypothetical protein